MANAIHISFAVPFVPAIEYARARKIVLPDTYYGEMQAEARSAAWSIAGVSRLDHLQIIFDSLANAIATGESFGSWKARIKKGEIPLDLTPSRIETIFRTNVQAAYGRGRDMQQYANRRNRPYLMYDAINDHRVRPTHAAMDGYIARWDDAIWKIWRPPAGYNCLLPGTRIRGDFLLGLQTDYAGPAVEIVTRSGARLSVTANHPVLASNGGWVSAQQLQCGDDLLRYGRVVDSSALRVEDDQEPPSTVEEIFDALSSQTLGRVDLSPLDLHGDAQFRKGNVYVACADGILVRGIQPVSSQQGEQRQFVRAADAGNRTRARSAGRLPLTNEGGPTVLFDDATNIGNTGSRGQSHMPHAIESRIAIDSEHSFLKFVISAARSLPRRAALALHRFMIEFQSAPFNALRLAATADMCAMHQEETTHRRTRNSDRLRQNFFARAGLVLRQQITHVLRYRFWSWPRSLPADSQAVLQRSSLDARIAQQTTEKAITDAGLFQTLAHRFPGNVITDQIASIRHFTFRGHVYDFQTRQGWMAANDLIVSNCRCTLISLSEAQAKARGLGRLRRPDVLPDDGWAYDRFAEPLRWLREARARAAEAVPSSVRRAAEEAARQADALDPTTWREIPNSQRGSTHGAIFEATDGTRYYVKFPEEFERARSEATAARVIEALGVVAAGSFLVEIDEGRIGIASRLSADHSIRLAEEDTPGVRKGIASRFRTDWTRINAADMREHAEDAVRILQAARLLGDYDFLGRRFGNLMRTPDDRLAIVDAGGAFRYRASGKTKPYPGRIEDMAEFLRLCGDEAASVYTELLDADSGIERRGAKALLRLDRQKIANEFMRLGFAHEERDELLGSLWRRRESLLAQYRLP